MYVLTFYFHLGTVLDFEIRLLVNTNMFIPSTSCEECILLKQTAPSCDKALEVHSIQYTMFTANRKSLNEETKKCLFNEMSG